MPDDLEIGVELGPLKVVLKGLQKWLTADPTAIVARRFILLFQEHGVSVPEIQHFFPSLTLEKIGNPHLLLAALTNDVLNEAAGLFQVQRSWLDGVDDEIYKRHFCYKRPGDFFERLAALPRDGGVYPVRALCAAKGLDRSNGRHQPIAVVLVEKIRELGEKEIFRYHIYGDGWDWSHAHCRIQLKAMARLVSKHLGTPVPLYPTKPGIVEEVWSGISVPRAYMTGSPFTEPSLEDYGLSPSASAIAREGEEFPAVLEYIEGHRLQEAAERCGRLY